MLHSLWHELAKAVRSADKFFMQSYFENFVDSRVFIHANRKIIPQNGYLHTFSSVNHLKNWLSWGLMFFFRFFLLKLKNRFNPKTATFLLLLTELNMCRYPFRGIIFRLACMKSLESTKFSRYDSRNTYPSLDSFC